MKNVKTVFGCREEEVGKPNYTGVEGKSLLSVGTLLMGGRLKEMV